MSKWHKTVCSLATMSVISAGASNTYADQFTEALKNSTPYGDFRLRYEDVDQDGTDGAEGLTLRSRIGIKTGSVNGISGTFEVEDVRQVFGIDDYKVGPTGFKTSTNNAVIADPESTEIDQAFLQYTGDTITAKLGRQRITLDGHRFVGDVGWRQDRQTFDGVSAVISPTNDLAITAAYISQRNRIFASDADIDSEDVLLHGAYKTSIGTVKGYAYLLETDAGFERDTYGVSFSGSNQMESSKLLYTLEYATQDTNTGKDADYIFAEAGIVVSGLTVKAGYEVLGSDNGTYGFTTELATLHKFNGWADKFLTTPNTGLVDSYLSIGGKVGPGKLTVIYHDFDADEDSPTVKDHGNELNAVYAVKFGDGYNAGVKYANYDAKDTSVDTEKFWGWLGLSF
ncbi:MAG: alginate export family protein [Motiliproteus sp.]|nr:alginate export family protein [Motiliproteus sp.]MCW9052806.1 alginate export family protein [Motiliproteus sp.]